MLQRFIRFSGFGLKNTLKDTFFIFTKVSLLSISHQSSSNQGLLLVIFVFYADAWGRLPLASVPFFLKLEQGSLYQCAVKVSTITLRDPAITESFWTLLPTRVYLKKLAYLISGIVFSHLVLGWFHINFCKYLLIVMDRSSYSVQGPDCFCNSFLSKTFSSKTHLKLNKGGWSRCSLAPAP